MYDTKIRKEVDKCNLFLFLISSASISPGRYTLTELQYASDKWTHPDGHVLPVLIEDVPFDSIPIYLRAVDILKPEGNTPAEILRAVNKLRARWLRRILFFIGTIAVGCLVLGLVGFWLWSKLPPDTTSISPTQYTLRGVIQDSSKKNGIRDVHVTAIGAAFSDTLRSVTTENGQYTIEQKLTDSAARLPVTLKIHGQGYLPFTIHKNFKELDSLSPLTSLLNHNVPTLPETTRTVSTTPRKLYIFRIAIKDSQTHQALTNARVNTNPASLPVTRNGNGNYTLRLSLTDTDAKNSISLVSKANGYISSTKKIVPAQQKSGDIIFSLTKSEGPPLPPFPDYKVIVWLDGDTGPGSRRYRTLTQNLKALGFDVEVEVDNILVSTPSVIYYRHEDARAAQNVSEIAGLGPPILVAQNGLSKTIKLLYK